MGIIGGESVQHPPQQRGENDAHVCVDSAAHMLCMPNVQYVVLVRIAKIVLTPM